MVISFLAPLSNVLHLIAPALFLRQLTFNLDVVFKKHQLFLKRLVLIRRIVYLSRCYTGELHKGRRSLISSYLIFYFCLLVFFFISVVWFVWFLITSVPNTTFTLSALRFERPFEDCPPKTPFSNEFGHDCLYYIHTYIWTHIHAHTYSLDYVLPPLDYVIWNSIKLQPGRRARIIWGKIERKVPSRFGQFRKELTLKFKK